ncbi:MAG: porin [Deltaproteobacteria bacterium]
MIYISKVNFASALILFSLLLSPTHSNAQSDSEQIEALKKQIKEVERKNREQIEELKRKIERLEAGRAADDEKVKEVVVKQEESGDAWYDKLRAQYKKGLTFESDDGNFMMRMRIFGQFQLSVDDTDGEDTATNFDVRRLRIKWDGHAFRPWFLYTVQIETVEDPILLDAYFDVAYYTKFVPRVGQFKVPFNREELTSSASLQFPERSIVNSEFTYGRDRGATLNGVLGNYVTYGAGIFNGDGINGTSVDSNLLYAGRVQFGYGGELEYSGDEFPSGGAYAIAPNFGGRTPVFVFGGALAGIPGLNIDKKIPNGDIETRFAQLGITTADVVSVTADANFKLYMLNVEAEYDGRWISPDEGGLDTAYDQGFRVQGGVFLLPKTIEIAGRWAFVDYDTNPGIFAEPGGDAPDREYELTPGLNFYLSKNQAWKIQLSYSFIRNAFTESDDIDENIFRTQLQAYF